MVSKPPETLTQIRMAHPSFAEDVLADIQRVLESGHLVQGAHVRQFEQAVLDYVDSGYAIACTSGTAALHLALLGLGIGPGDEVIVPDYTFPATANVVEVVGARPVFVDVEAETFNIDPTRVEAVITERTRAIMPVHLFGLAADMDSLNAFANHHGLPVVEDAACALGARFPNALGDSSMIGRNNIACFSFHPRKVITTGEGGLVTTNDEAVAARLRQLRNHGAEGQAGRVEYSLPGLNYRMTEMQAVLGISQMKALSPMIEKRRQLAAEYSARLRGLRGIRVPVEREGFFHIYQSYVVALSAPFERARVIQGLADRRIESTIGTYALHEQPYYRDRYQLDAAAFPIATQVSADALSLPLHPRMEIGDVRRVCDALEEIGA